MKVQCLGYLVYITLLFQWWCWCIIEHYFCRYQYHSSDPLGLPKWIIQACIKGVFKLFCNKSVLFIWYLMQWQQDFPLTKNLWNHCNMHNYPIANLSIDFYHKPLINYFKDILKFSLEIPKVYHSNSYSVDLTFKVMCMIN